MDENISNMNGSHVMNMTYFDPNLNSQFVQAIKNSNLMGAELQQQEQYSLVSCMSDSPVKLRNSSAMYMDQQNEQNLMS